MNDQPQRVPNELAFQNILNLFLEKYENKQFTVSRRNESTVEVIASYIPLNPMQQKLDFGVWKTNEEYAKREVEWYESQSLFVKDIPGETPTIWENISSEEGKINSNYGYLIYSNENGNQYQNCLNELIEDPVSRRAQMIYTRPEIYTDRYKNGMKDQICTESVQALIRNNSLYFIVKMRSNDLFYGFFNDYAWQTHVYWKMFGELQKRPEYELLQPGEIIWEAGSLHVYSKHYKYLKGMTEYVNNLAKEYE